MTYNYIDWNKIYLCKLIVELKKKQQEASDMGALTGPQYFETRSPYRVANECTPNNVSPLLKVRTQVVERRAIP